MIRPIIVFLTLMSGSALACSVPGGMYGMFLSSDRVELIRLDKVEKFLATQTENVREVIGVGVVFDGSGRSKAGSVVLHQAHSLPCYSAHRWPSDPRGWYIRFTQNGRSIAVGDPSTRGKAVDYYQRGIAAKLRANSKEGAPRTGNTWKGDGGN